VLLDEIIETPPEGVAEFLYQHQGCEWLMSQAPRLNVDIWRRHVLFPCWSIIARTLKEYALARLTFDKQMHPERDVCSFSESDADLG